MGFFFLQSSDDSIGNVIFIVIVIVYTIVQLLMGKKKPEKKSQIPTAPEEEEDEEEDEFFEEEPVASPQVARQVPPVVITPARQKSKEVSFEFSSSLENFKQTTTIEQRKLDLLHIEERSGEVLVSSHLKKLASQNVPQHKEVPHAGLETIFAKIPPKKMLILSHEILSKPLSTRR